jgi:hypothetical protein
MSDEPLSEIIAEMRDERIIRIEDADATRCLLRNLADRIEAAAKREYEEAKDYFAKLHDGPSMICTATNCAVRNIGLSFDAPVRNCDRFADCNSAWKAYNAIAGRERLPGFDFWLFEKVKEGGARRV